MWVDESTVGLDLDVMAVAQDPSEAAAKSVRSDVPEPASIALLGVPFDRLTLEGAVKEIDGMIQSGRPHYVVTANVDFLVQAMHDIELRRILLGAQMVLCDGTPLVWVSRLMGNPLPERVAGSDLVPRLLERAVAQKYRLFFLGGTQESCDQAIANLHDQYPALNIVGHLSPPFRDLLDLPHEVMAEKIREAKPDILFVAFGCPKAEKWMAMHCQALGVPLMIGVGATIDFLAGRFKRAPSWIQQSGLEWVYRLSQEPKRLWRRYAHDLRFVGGAVLKQWLALGPQRGWISKLQNADFKLKNEGSSRVQSGEFKVKNGHSKLQIGAAIDGEMVTGHPSIFSEPTWQRVEAPVYLDAATLNGQHDMWSQIGEVHCLLDMDRVEFIDSTGVGLLVKLHKRLRSEGKTLVLVSPTKCIDRALRLMRLDDYFVIAQDAVEARQLIENLEHEVPVVANDATALDARPLRWQGEITAANVEQVWSVTREYIDSTSPEGTTIKIDLEGVRFIDSSGAGLMVRTKRYGAQCGRCIMYENISAPVLNVLTILKLKEFLASST